MKTKSIRALALLLALMTLFSALPMAASAASYYAVINGKRVESDSCTVFGSAAYVYLDEISITPHSDYYRSFDFYEKAANGRYQYIDEDSTYRLYAGQSVYIALYADAEAYRNESYTKLLQLTYSNEEFGFSAETDSVYLLSLKDFDPSGVYGLTGSYNDGTIVINEVPSHGTLYLDNTAVVRGARISLREVRTNKLSYRAPRDGAVTDDSFEFTAYSSSNVTLIPQSTMYIDLSKTNPSGLASNADVQVSLTRDGTYVFTLDDFDYSTRTYNVDDFTYLRITSLPDYGYVRYLDGDIRTSTWIKLSDVRAGKLYYTLDSETDYDTAQFDTLSYVVYTANQNGVYTGTLNVDISLFSTAGHGYVVKTDARGSRVFRLSDFDDPDGKYTAASYTSTSSRNDGYITLMTIPFAGTLYLEDQKLAVGDDVPLDSVRQGLLKYEPDSVSASTPDVFEFILFSASDNKIARDDMYIDRTAVRTGVSSDYGADAVVVWMNGKEDYTFTLADLDDPKANRPLEDYHSSRNAAKDGSIELLSLPETGALTLYSGRNTQTLRKGDVITLDEIASGELHYSRDTKATADYTSFAFCGRDYRGQTITSGSVTAYIDFYGSAPKSSSSYTYSVSKAAKTVRVEFTDLTEDTITHGTTASLTAGDLTDLAAAAGFTGGVLELAADVKGSSLSSRTITLDSALFTDLSKSSVFSTIRIVATDAGQNTSGSSITNVCKLAIPVASVSSLYTMTTADFSVTLEKYSMTAADKTNMPNSSYNGGLARRVTFYVGNTKVNVANATLTLPYGKITSKASTVVMMCQQSGGGFAPALSSRYSASDYTVSAYCSSGYVCTPYYRGADSGMSFSDLSAANVSWATDYVYNLAARDVVQGVGGGLFSPSTSVTRAEFIKMLVGSLGLYDASASCSFTDVSGSASWAYGYIASAVKAGIVDDGASFQPNKAIDRQTMALYAYRASLSGAANIMLPTTYAAETFLDQAQISANNLSAVVAMQRAGIIQGDGAGHFDPTGTTTRAAAAKIICMLMQFKYQ